MNNFGGMSSKRKILYLITYAVNVFNVFTMFTYHIKDI